MQTGTYEERNREKEQNLRYCMSSFLMYRTVVDRTKSFSDNFPPFYRPFPADRRSICDSDALLAYLREAIAAKTKGKKCALALSGGIDSAILLTMMPEDTITYTFKCIVPGKEVTDETPRAREYLAWARPELLHRVVPVCWEDMESMIDPLMRHKGSPTHSIEVQIYKAARQAKEDGCDMMIFGETADCIYGGHSDLLSRDYTVGEFADRWSFVKPWHVLKDPRLVMEPFRQFAEDGAVNVPAFLTDFESGPSLNFYENACALAGIELYAPYAHTRMGVPLDLERVRRGENKYIVREVFQKLYPDMQIPPKTPMPRPMNEWFADWPGPSRPEFWPHCTDHMTGDQKWLVYVLERFLNMISSV